jgi:urease accessory protein
MESDSRKMRGEQPFLFTNLRDEVGLDAVVTWVEEKLGAPADSRRKLLDVYSPPSDSHAHGHGHHHHH